MIEISIIGAGNVGSLLTYLMNRSYVYPRLVFKRDRVAEDMYLENIDGRRAILRYKPVVYDDYESWIYSDIIVIATKAYDAESIIRDISARIPRNKEELLVVVTQNGLKILEIAAELIGPDKISQLVLNQGVHRINSNTFRWIGGSQSYLGMLKGYRNKYLEIFKDLLREINIEVVEDIQPYRWLKLAVNAVINPITAIMRARNKIIVENSYIKDLIARKICEEVEEVARRNSIEMPADPYEEVIKIARSTGDNYSSMLSDVLNCKRTEIDYINGAVIEYGLRRGFKPIYNEILYYMVKAQEETCHAREDLAKTLYKS
ncbi:MAG: ketopantoate reductase family protein [Sulfolobales archaeon]